MNCRSSSSCSEWPYPTKINQHKYTGKALVAEWCNGKVCVCVCVCMCRSRCPPVCLLSGPAGDGCCRKTGIFPENLLMFWHIITVRHSPSTPFKDLFSTDPSSIDWTTGLEPMENSSISQSNTHCKCQGVLFSDWKVPFHLLTFLSGPSLVQDNRRINHVV